MHKAKIHLEAEIGGPAARVIFLVSTKHGHTHLPAITWSEYGSKGAGAQAKAVEAWADSNDYDLGPWEIHGDFFRAVLTPREPT